MSDQINELLWHDDGHQIYLRLEKSLVRVSPMDCPFQEAPDAACYHVGISGCSVKYFVQMYGLDVNVGVADPVAEMPISWAIQGDAYSIDHTQVWIIPNSDTQFAAFLETQRAEDDDE